MPAAFRRRFEGHRRLRLEPISDQVQLGGRTASTYNDFSLTGAVLAVSTFAFWGTVLGWVGYHWRQAERWIEGAPWVLRKRRRIEADLKRDRHTRREPESEMRLAEIARLDDVAWAILEPEGKIRFLRRDGGDVLPNDGLPA
ncbi:MULTISPECIES: YetF domain-containing protein [unclassified Sphingomonas]|jgi:uncharacterized membrane protein YcaP (DUF421 family)|uniref:YetF domain-containing protein n=1 Tax=unclassified Sphingomonas TaxID=196159 RepID=UPI000ADC7D8F|nr:MULTISPECIES: YetF domain-containing protein [unclassified Sphingomonas]